MKDNGGPAYPSIKAFEVLDKGPGDYKTTFVNVSGMTLWDYFAAHALASCSLPMSPTEATDWSAEAADAMIVERKKRFGNN